MNARCRFLAAAAVAVLLPIAEQAHASSIAREWNEALLSAIRRDLARPTVHARNLFHVSLAMWDAWAAYDDFALTYLHHERATADDVEAAREEAISFAAYRILRARFANPPGGPTTLPALDARMDALGYDKTFTSVDGDSPAALGNRIAAAVLAFGAADGSNEENFFANQFYTPANPSIDPKSPGNPLLLDPNRWQPIALDLFIDQAGNVIVGGSPPFQSPEWGVVTPFALTAADRTIGTRDGFDYWFYHDPGPPPLFGGVGHDEYHATFELVLEWSGQLDPTDGVMIDIGPGARGNSTLGTNDGIGYSVNPKTGLPYAPQVVPAGDYYRVLAEFWADGPMSETPPGHWFTIANHVADHPDFVRRIGGVGPVLDPLEWDVKLYLALGGAMHDVAVTVWGMKGWYDYVRPISAIRFLADLGQRSDPDGPSYHPDGITLVPGRVEVVTAESSAPGERHEHLAGPSGENVGKIAARAWRGPDFIDDPETDTAGVGWILVENWWPYQRPTFVTPPFAGYVSGHSTFSRAAATVLELMTGDPFFPGGLGEFPAPQNEFLVFEEGPSVDVTLQWAKYADASDECSLSRIYGGIHPPADDIPGRFIGAAIAPDAVARATTYFGPRPTLAIKRAAARPERPGRGRLTIEGTLSTEVYGAEDVLAVSDGLRIRVRDGLALDEVALLEADDCATTRTGKIRCRSDDRSVKATFRPARTAGEREFEIHLEDRELVAPVAGPLRLDLEAGGIARAGRIETCVDYEEKLVCKG
ncbi:MAG: vanadium-dependent haloperoxidase [Deltaproteobacteria bacterium]|nr:vanadium-dependent haloperoxidase [Deltaproteobacteria bacterium]